MSDLLRGLLSLRAPVGMYSLRVGDFVQADDKEIGFIREMRPVGDRIEALIEYQDFNFRAWYDIARLRKHFSD